MEGQTMTCTHATNPLPDPIWCDACGSFVAGDQYLLTPAQTLARYPYLRPHVEAHTPRAANVPPRPAWRAIGLGLDLFSASLQFVVWGCLTILAIVFAYLMIASGVAFGAPPVKHHHHPRPAHRKHTVAKRRTTPATAAPARASTPAAEVEAEPWAFPLTPAEVEELDNAPPPSPAEEEELHAAAQEPDATQAEIQQSERESAEWEAQG
jgi:hypothetical protein